MVVNDVGGEGLEAVDVDGGDVELEVGVGREVGDDGIGETNEVRNTVSDHIAKHMKYSEAYEPNPSVTQTQPIAMITQQQSLTRIAYETNVVSDINT